MTPQIQIMVVEDEAIVAMEIENRLKSLGYGVCAVTNTGERALDKAANTQPNLVLMDIQIKGTMDGVETARQIRERFDIPVIYLTAHSDEHTLQRAKISEPFGYILKPFDERDLHTTIEMALYRYRLERKLKESERWLNTTLSSIGDGVIATDGRGCITFMNPAAEALTGWKQANALGRKLAEVFDIIHEESQVPAESPVTKVLREGTMVALANHILLLNEDGRETAIEDNASPIRDEQGNICGVVLVFRDITARKKVEATMQKAKNAAEASNRAKSEFLANVSHEIRTPLNGVLGMAELLLDTSLTHEQQDYVKTIQHSGDTLLVLINDILNLSKIEAGKLELKERPFNLRASIEETLDGLAGKAAEKNLELSYYIEDGTPEVLIGDVTRVTQVLGNLLSNAVKFTEVGEVALTVTAHRVSAGQEGANPVQTLNYEVHFAVRDTGIGIPPDRWGRLFQSFSQVDGSMSRRYGGTGLGLAISKRLSELMGGTIRVESDGVPGLGSTFHFTIRAKTALSQRSVSSNDPPSALAGKRLLIVDGHATNRHNLTRQTRLWGMLPQDTDSIAEAMVWLEQGDLFDTAILGVQEVEKDGLKLIKDIRQGRNQALPLIISAPVGQKQEIILPPGNDIATVLTRPVKYSLLYNVLVDTLAKQANQQETQKSLPATEGTLASRHPLQILLAEDDPVNRRVALLFLHTMGYQADVAANGLEVLAQLARQQYDVVLMDIQMPEMDGLEATAQIYQQWPPQQRPRIIALTANTVEGDRERYLAAGIDDYLSKPIKIKALSEVLERCQPLNWENSVKL